MEVLTLRETCHDIKFKRMFVPIKRVRCGTINYLKSMNLHRSQHSHEIQKVFCFTSVSNIVIEGALDNETENQGDGEDV